MVLAYSVMRMWRGAVLVMWFWRHDAGVVDDDVLAVQKGERKRAQAASL